MSQIDTGSYIPCPVLVELIEWYTDSRPLFAHAHNVGVPLSNIMEEHHHRSITPTSGQAEDQLTYIAAGYAHPRAMLEHAAHTLILLTCTRTHTTDEQTFPVSTSSSVYSESHKSSSNALCTL